MATHMPMAAARQPFAPVNASRLHTLTSVKNRQNALPNTISSPGKRKATAFEDDCENIDPVIFLTPKRSKGSDCISKDTLLKPTNFFLTKAPPSPNEIYSPLKPTIVSARRPILQARSPIQKLNNSISKSSPLSAPAGRSPTRKRIGILNRRRTASEFTRIDAPKFAVAAGPGFSIDAALSGTIPSYGARKREASLSSTASSSKARSAPLSLCERESKDSWFFDIHEDTAEELATNLMEHSTCTLDISSDEESAARSKDQRGKENVPPPDDVSQTHTVISHAAAAEPSMSAVKSRVRASRRQKQIDDGAIDVDRSPLGEMAAEDFYAAGCDDSSVILVLDDSVDLDEETCEEDSSPPMTFDFITNILAKGKGQSKEVDDLMQRHRFESVPKAALLEPLEQAEEEFQLWESGSAKGDE